MDREDKLKRLEELTSKANELKREIDYYNALQLALKLVLNGSYGAFATQHFVLFNNHVASSITAEGRRLLQVMDEYNNRYWYEYWDKDKKLHERLCITDIKPIDSSDNVSVYGDTDSLFVSFYPAINKSTWKNRFLNDDYLSGINEKFLILNKSEIHTNNPNCVGCITKVKDIENIKDKYDLIIIDGYFVKNRDFNNIKINSRILWNWSCERDYIQGIDKFRIADYFLLCLNKHANSYGVENKHDFELERISESIINIAKKKYIQHISHEDGIDYERFKYIFPKGVELVRSSTPTFAREKIVDVVKYLFSHPNDYNIKDLLKLVSKIRKEFELANIDDICMQSSVSDYDNKIINDKELPISYVDGTHFAVKAAAYHNYLLHNNKELQQKYEFIKSGIKIKYYYTKKTNINNVFAYIRGSHPIEFAPDIDFDTQFEKCILSPINSIITNLNMPTINKRLRVIMDIFSGF
jgi:DNA polymerase elongation subunit (family B)